MLNKKLTVTDLESVDPEFYNSLGWIRYVTEVVIQHPFWYFNTTSCTRANDNTIEYVIINYLIAGTMT